MLLMISVENHILSLVNYCMLSLISFVVVKVLYGFGYLLLSPGSVSNILPLPKERIGHLHH